jgi:SAM-dependent methyltransferase
MADLRAVRGHRVRLFLLALFPAALFMSCATGGVLDKEADTVYLPTPPAAVAAMLRLADVTEKDTVYDLGSGDGRIVIAAARDFHATAVGIEIDPALVAESRSRAREAGLSGRAAFIEGDIFKVDLKNATVVTLYLLPGPNLELIPKLLSELAPGSRVVSHMHDMGDWQPDRTQRVGESTIYMWVVPANVYGKWDVRIDDPQAPAHGTLFIRQAFQALNGSLSIDGGHTTRFDAKLDGGRFAFTANGGKGAARQTLEYRAVARGDLMEGELIVKSLSTGRTRRVPWTASRRERRSD